MVKKLTADDWETIQKESPSRYYILSEEDGTVRITFDTEIVVVEKGDEDLIGNIWEKDWDKLEARVFIDGEPKVFSFGGRGWSFGRAMIGLFKKNEISPEQVPGCVFDITKTGDFDYDVKFISKGGDVKPKKLELKDDKLGELRDVIVDLKNNSMDMLKNAEKKPDFLKLLYIRSKIKPSESENYLPKLEEEGLLLVDGDKITVL